MLSMFYLKIFTYVDDIKPGAETEAGRDNKILSTQSVLQQGEFGFR